MKNSDKVKAVNPSTIMAVRFAPQISIVFRFFHALIPFSFPLRFLLLSVSHCYI